MPTFRPFTMERWQSTWEHRVACNLSESGVHPLSLQELLSLADEAAADVPELQAVQLGYAQSNGSDLLRTRIAALYDGADDGCVVVTNGSAEANFVALWTLLEPGDELAVLVPTYMQTPGLAASFGAAVRPIRLYEERGWQPDPAEIAAAIGARTRVVVVTNPGNPTGAVLGEEARAAVIAAADRVGAWILADEVYSGAELEGAPTRSFFGGYERVIATGSLSKAYGLPGLRIGWTVSDAPMAERLWAHTDYTTIAPATLSDALACLALDAAVRPRLLARTRTLIHAGLETLETWLAEQEVFSWRAPQAGAICYARYDLPIDSAALAELWRVEHDVLVVPGSHFDMDRYVRFGFGLPPHMLTAGLERIAASLPALRTLVAPQVY
jgi:aspartate/methionine/tyrosine aminotransferase